MSGVLVPLLLTLDKYLFCTETYKFGNHKISYVNMIQAMTKYYMLIAS